MLREVLAQLRIWWPVLREALRIIRQNLQVQGRRRDSRQRRFLQIARNIPCFVRLFTIMAPAVQTFSSVDASNIHPKGADTDTVLQSESSIAPRAPLQTTGILDSLYESEEVTPVIGRLYPTLQLKDVVHHEKADELIRDLAITISRRGVVFFKNQDLSPEEQKFLVNRLGHLTGKPPSSGLHIHPILNAERQGNYQIVDEKGTINNDNEISVISSELNRKLGSRSLYSGKRSGADEWHSDIAFENVPSDYTALKVHTLPTTGGDTIWSSGYEVYDLLSTPFKKLFEGLQGIYQAPQFREAAERNGYQLHEGPRGAADNVGTDLDTKHPLVRTNPVTGWKSVFGVGNFLRQIENLTTEESESVKRYVRDLVTQNHATQVRYRWGKNDLAIWDNRSTYHAATPDYFDIGPRSGVRAVSCGERPYYDPSSISRRDELKGGRLI